MKTALVVPTIRENCIKDFLESWAPENFDTIIVVEDNPEKTFKLGLAHHYSWKEIDEYLGQNSWIISRRDSAIRSFGFYIAKRLWADVIFTLDDDCYRIPEENFVKNHIKNLTAMPKWTELIPGLRTRGIPYHNKGTIKSVMNVGLWTNVPDLDAINQLANPIENFQPNVVNRIIPKGQYFPFTGMNFCFESQVTPLTYFPLMGKDSPYGRFDDIWFGVIAKKACDDLDFNISVGHPFVEHKRASNPFTNLKKEAPGIELNETFWEIIEKFSPKRWDHIGKIFLCPTDYAKQMGTYLTTQNNDYIKKLGEALQIWASLF
jgi:reversibly glycosylated polypeptide/UDP-arabinopyranose mutase